MRRCLSWWPMLALAAALAVALTGPSVSAQGLAGAAGSGSAKKSASQGAPALDLTSPRRTVLSFGRLAHWAGQHEGEGRARAKGRKNGKASGPASRAWAEAGRALALGGADPAAAPERARQLGAILDKLGEIDPRWLASASYAAKARLHEYTLFPRAHFDWVVDQLGAPPGAMTLSLGSDGLWRFSAPTVARLPDLAAYFAPLQPAQQAGTTDQVMQWLGPTFQQTHWWGWVVLLGGILLGLVVGKLVQSGCKAAADRMGRRHWDARSAALRDAISPLGLAFLALGLQVGLHFIALQPMMHEKLVLPALKFLYILAAGWFLYNLVDVVETYLRRLTSRTKSKIDDMVIPLVRKSLRIFVVVVFTLVVAQNVFGLDITGWLAGLGIAGLAVSLAAQDSIKNLFGSLTVFFDKPFVVGHFIEFQDYTGTVEEIGFRSTRIRTLDGHLVTVPNMKFIDQNVKNISARPYIRRVMDITITYDTPPDKIDRAVEMLTDVMHDPEVVESGRFDMDQFPPRVAFDQINAASLNLKVYYWYQLARDPNRGFWTYFEHTGLVNRKLFERFGEAGVDLALPAQTLYLAGDDKRELAVTLRREGDGEGHDEGTARASD